MGEKMNRASGRSASIARHFAFASDLLQGREHDRHSLARRLQVRLAMADRLLNAAVTFLPGVQERRDGKTRKIKMNVPSNPAEPGYATAVAACFGSSLWPLFEGSTYQTGIRDALTHVIGRTKRRAVFKDIDRKFWFLRRGGEPALLDRATLLDEVLEAVLHSRAISIAYTRFEGGCERLRLEPLSIVVHDHQLYVVGREEKGSLHPYRFSRIAEVDVLDDPFTYPTRSEYDPAQVFHDSFGVFLNLPARDVEIVLHKRWSTFAQTHRWHVSQVVDVAEEHVRVTLHVRVCPELEAWILGFGEDAEVISPPELRDRIAARARRLVQKYASVGARRPRRKGDEVIPRSAGLGGALPRRRA
jgi:hypothetical protein